MTANKSLNSLNVNSTATTNNKNNGGVSKILKSESKGGHSSDDDEWDEEVDSDESDLRNLVSEDEDEDEDDDNDDDDNDYDVDSDTSTKSTSSSRTGSGISIGSHTPTNWSFLAAPHICLRKGRRRSVSATSSPVMAKSDDESSGNEYDADPDGDEDDSAYFSDLEELEDTAERGILHGNAKIRLKAANHDSTSSSSSTSSSREGSIGSSVTPLSSQPLTERFASAPLIMTSEATSTTTTPTTPPSTSTSPGSSSSSSSSHHVLSLSEPRPRKSSIEVIIATPPPSTTESTNSDKATELLKAESKLPALDITITPEPSPQPLVLFDHSPAPRKGSDAGFLQLPVDLERQIQRASLIIVDGAVKQPALGSKQRSVKQFERPKSEPGPEGHHDKMEKPLSQSSPSKTPKAASDNPQEGGLNRSKHMERKRAARNAKNNVHLNKSIDRGDQQPPQPGLSPVNQTPRKTNATGDANTKKFYDMVTEGAVQTRTKMSKMGSVTTIDNIQLGELIGKGAFGSVYRGLNSRTGKLVAVKRMPVHVKPEVAESLMTEMSLMESFDHPNIVKYIQFIPSRNHFNFVMEFAEGGSLQNILKNFGSFEESLVLVYLSQVLEGMLYLHSRNVIHRDIKAANILLTKDGVVKLADFGISLVMEAQHPGEDQPQWGEGSPYWMAPEVIQGHRPTTAGDIWSLGCTVFELVTGAPPYGDMPAMSALFKMVHEGHPPLPVDISDALRDFLLRCFRFDPVLRPSASDLLEHPFVTRSNLLEYQESHPLKEECSHPHREDETADEKKSESRIQSDASLINDKTGSCSNLLASRSRNISICDDEGTPMLDRWKSNSAQDTIPVVSSLSFGGSKFESKYAKSQGSSVAIRQISEVLPLENFWNVPIKGTLHKTIALPSNLKVTSMIIVDDYIWIGCGDGSIAVYTNEGDFMSRNVDSHKGAINQFLFLGDGLNQVWSCSNDCTVKIWNSKLGTFPKPKQGWLDLDVKTLTGTKKRKTWCVINQSLFAYYRNDSGKEKDLLGTVPLSEDSVLAVDRSKKNRRYCFTLESSNKRFRFYASDVEEMTEWMRAFYTAMRGNNVRHVHTLPTPDHLEVNCMLSVNNTVWIGGMDMTIRVWKKKTNQLVREISLEQYGLSLKKMERVVWRMLKLRYEKAIWVACGNIIIRVHSEKLVPIDELHGHERLINCMIETRGGLCREKGVTEVWTCGGDKMIRIWNSKTGNCEKHWEGHHDKIAQLLWTGDHVWSSSWGSTIRLWKNKTGDFDEEIPTQSKFPIICLALSEKNEEMYLGSSDSTVYVWK